MLTHLFSSVKSYHDKLKCLSMDIIFLSFKMCTFKVLECDIFECLMVKLWWNVFKTIKYYLSVLVKWWRSDSISFLYITYVWSNGSEIRLTQPLFNRGLSLNFLVKMSYFYLIIYEKMCSNVTFMILKWNCDVKHLNFKWNWPAT